MSEKDDVLTLRELERLGVIEKRPNDDMSGYDLIEAADREKARAEFRQLAGWIREEILADVAWLTDEAIWIDEPDPHDYSPEGRRRTLAHDAARDRARKAGR
jgi:hypothetical protein